jgi:catalase
MLNGPKSFKGRKIGVLVSDGVDAKLLAALKSAATLEGATVEIVAPTVGGVTASDGTHVPADRKVNAGPSVLFDSVAVLVSEAGAGQLAGEATAKDFISDAYAHLKFIAYSGTAKALLDQARVSMDDGFILLKQPEDTKKFVNECRHLRLWSREPKIKLAKGSESATSQPGKTEAHAAAPNQVSGNHKPIHARRSFRGRRK